MNGFTFYEVFTHKRKGISGGQAIAVFGRLWLSGNRPVKDAIAGLLDAPNSPVCGTSVSMDYLRETCKRISERRAREIHPALFDRLDVK